MRKLTVWFAIVVVVFFGAITQVSAWTTYSTNWGSPGWDNIKVLSATNYDNNTSTKVTILDTYTHYDNNTGSNQINCSLLRLTQGNGTEPVDLKHFSFSVPPYTYRIDHFSYQGDYYKYGNWVNVNNGGTFGGNCSFDFVGWDIRFQSNGVISHVWR